MGYVRRSLVLVAALVAGGPISPPSDYRTILKRLISEGRLSAPDRWRRRTCWPCRWSRP
jgi:hypothetical protein